MGSKLDSEAYYFLLVFLLLIAVGILSLQAVVDHPLLLLGVITEVVILTMEIVGEYLLFLSRATKPLDEQAAVVGEIVKVSKWCLVA